MYEVIMWANGAPNEVKVFEGNTLEECEQWIEKQPWIYEIRYDIWLGDELVERM